MMEVVEDVEVFVLHTLYQFLYPWPTQEKNVQFFQGQLMYKDDMKIGGNAHEWVRSLHSG